MIAFSCVLLTVVQPASARTRDDLRKPSIEVNLEVLRSLRATGAPGTYMPIPSQGVVPPSYRQQEVRVVDRQMQERVWIKGPPGIPVGPQTVSPETSAYDAEMQRNQMGGLEKDAPLDNLTADLSTVTIPSPRAVTGVSTYQPTAPAMASPQAPIARQPVARPTQNAMMQPVKRPAMRRHVKVPRPRLKPLKERPVEDVVWGNTTEQDFTGFMEPDMPSPPQLGDPSLNKLLGEKTSATPPENLPEPKTVDIPKMPPIAGVDKKGDLPWTNATKKDTPAHERFEIVPVDGAQKTTSKPKQKNTRKQAPKLVLPKAKAPSYAKPPALPPLPGMPPLTGLAPPPIPSLNNVIEDPKPAEKNDITMPDFAAPALSGTQAKNNASATTKADISLPALSPKAQDWLNDDSGSTSGSQEVNEVAPLPADFNMPDFPRLESIPPAGAPAPHNEIVQITSPTLPKVQSQPVAAKEPRALPKKPAPQPPKLKSKPLTLPPDFNEPLKELTLPTPAGVSAPLAMPKLADSTKGVTKDTFKIPEMPAIEAPIFDANPPSFNLSETPAKEMGILNASKEQKSIIAPANSTAPIMPKLEPQKQYKEPSKPLAKPETEEEGMFSGITDTFKNMLTDEEETKLSNPPSGQGLETRKVALLKPDTDGLPSELPTPANGQNIGLPSINKPSLAEMPPSRYASNRGLPSLNQLDDSKEAEKVARDLFSNDEITPPKLNNDIPDISLDSGADYEVIERNNKPVLEKANEEMQIAALPSPAAKTTATTSNSGAKVKVVYSRENTDIPSEVRSALKSMAAKAKGDNKRIMVTAYASGEEDERKAANMVSLSRGLSLRAFLIDEGVAMDQIIVKAKGIDNDGGAKDRADLVLE